MMLIYYKTWIYQCLIKQVKSPSTWSRVPNSVWIRQSGRDGIRGVTQGVYKRTTLSRGRVLEERRVVALVFVL